VLEKTALWGLHNFFWSTNVISVQPKEDETLEKHLEFLWKEEKAM
jgi:hypothetical protein